MEELKLDYFIGLNEEVCHGSKRRPCQRQAKANKESRNKIFKFTLKIKDRDKTDDEGLLEQVKEKNLKKKRSRYLLEMKNHVMTRGIGQTGTKSISC